MGSRSRSDINYSEYSITLAAGATSEQLLAFKWLEVIAADNDTLEVTLDEGATFFPLRRGINLRPEDLDLSGQEIDIGRIRLRNTGVSTVIATLATGSSQMRNNRFAVASGGNVPITAAATLPVGGETADGAAAGSTKPVQVGGVDGSGNVQRIMTDAAGNVRTSKEGFKGNRVRGQTGAMTGTGDTVVIAAPGAGFHHVITSIVLYNKHATVQTEIAIKDGTTELFRVNIKAGSATSGDMTLAIPIPDGLQLSSNTALNAANITTGSDTRVAAFGFKEAD